MAMKVKEVSDLVGISVRTLHHYDHIGLLVPSETTEAGYRLYTDEDIEKLQQILFFRALDFPLKEIKKILESPAYNREEALKLQRKMLLEKRNMYDQMIETIDKTIQHMKGEIEMSNKEKFKGIDFSHNPYEDEARKLWGDKSVDQANEKLKKRTTQEQEELKKKWEQLFTKLAKIRHEAPESDKAQAAMKEWYVFLNQFHEYSCDAFAGLGEMYVYDERFTKNIDQYGEGLAKFMSDAMKVFAERQKENG